MKSEGWRCGEVKGGEVKSGEVKRGRNQCHTAMIILTRLV